MVYMYVIYLQTQFCEAWWQTTQVIQVHQVQPNLKEATLEKQTKRVTLLPLESTVFSSFIYLFHSGQESGLPFTFTESFIGLITVTNFYSLSVNTDWSCLASLRFQVLQTLNAGHVKISWPYLARKQKLVC